MRQAPNKKLPNFRRIHATFTAIYTIIAAFWLGAPIFFVNYEVIFQSGLTGFFIGIAFLMLSIVMVGKQLCRQVGEFMILYRHIISIIFCSVAAIILSFFYLWNLINILSMCDTFAANASATSLEQTQIDLLISYKIPTNGIIRQQALSLKYNPSERRIVRNQRGAPPLPPNPMQSFRYEAKTLKLHRQQCELVHSLHASSSEEEEEEVATSDYERNHFYMLANEVQLLLEEELKQIDERSSYQVKSLTPIHTTSAEEDALFQELRARKICRNEQGFAIFLSVLLIVMMILNLITIGVYAWIRSYLCTLWPLYV